MPIDRLAIPMQTNQARQNFWRALGLCLLLGLLIATGFMLERAMHFRSVPERWPADATSEIRVIKSVRAQKFVTTSLAGVQALPNSPWQFSEAWDWSDRQLIIYTNANEVVGLTVDGQIPTDTLQSLADWGWQVNATGQRSLITRQNSAEPLPAKRRLSPWLTWPGFDGAITVKNPAGEFQQTVFSYASAENLDIYLPMSDFLPTHSLSLSENSQPLGYFTLPNSLLSKTQPFELAANFPGLNLLSHKASLASITLLLGLDEEQLTFTAATNSLGLSLEELGAIANEALSLQNLSTTELTINDLPTSLELRNLGEINISINTDNDIQNVVATDQADNLFRITQTTEQTILSNRPHVIAPIQNKLSNSCLPQARGFIRPSTLQTLLSDFERSEGLDLISHLSHSQEVAFRKNKLRICW